MRSWISASLILLGFSGTAMADEAMPSVEQCQVLTRHIPDASVAYQPSHDVVPADLDPQSPVTGPMTMDLKAPKSTNGSVANPLTRPLIIGQITVSLDAQGQAHLSMNGQPLGADDQVRLATLCNRRR